jgi:hypothetical protein
VADPVGRMHEAYDRLGLGDFDRVRDQFEEQARSMKGYKTNTYRHDPRLVAEIERRWRPFIDRYGYRVPEAATSAATAAPAPA